MLILMELLHLEELVVDGMEVTMATRILAITRKGTLKWNHLFKSSLISAMTMEI